MFQILDSRMRRAVQQENRSIQASLSATNNKWTRTQSTKTRRSNCAMIMMFLSPIAVLLTVILLLKTFHGWRVQEPELENFVHAVKQEASSATSKTNNGSTSNVRKPSKQQPKPTNDAPDVSIKSQQHARYKALVLTTEFGKIRIVLLPGLFPLSL
jgi:cytoskeletal protein RodZ